MIGFLFFEKGSNRFNFEFSGKLAIWVNVFPKAILMVARALTAHPFASSNGARFLFRSLSHAMIIDGPEIARIIPNKANGIFHHDKPKNPVSIEAITDPIAPRARLNAAKIPTNFPMSKG